MKALALSFSPEVRLHYPMLYEGFKDLNPLNPMQVQVLLQANL